MIESYFQNSSVSMTKDSYFQMCDMLGTEPVEEEIPIEINDFPVEVQLAIEVYYRLRDEWDSMNGIYIGKSYVGLIDILNILEIPKQDRKLILDWLSVMDNVRGKAIRDAKPKNNK